MKRLFKHKYVRLAALTVVIGTVAGFVYAAWTTNGSGSAYTKAGSAQTLSTLDVSASTTATLYPSGNGDVLIKIDNPNPYPVTVTGVSGNGTVTPDSTHSGCSPTGVTFNDRANLSISVPAKANGTDGVAQATLTNAASMSNSSVDACQGATFTIPVTLAGQSG